MSQTKVKEAQVNDAAEADIKNAAAEFANEKINYIAKRPIGTDPKETDVTVTVNGTNYRVMYDVPVQIPRFVAEVLERTYNESVKLNKKITEATEQARSIGEF